MSLALRLSALLSALWLLILVPAGWAIFHGVQQQADASATQQATAIVASLRRELGPSPDRASHFRDRDFLNALPTGVLVTIRQNGQVVNSTSAGATALTADGRLQSQGGHTYWVGTWTLQSDTHTAATIGIPFDSQSRFLAALQLELGTIGLGALIVIVGAQYLLIASRLRPLRELSHVAKRLGQGDWGRRFPLGRIHDEIGELGRSFNTMADELEETFERQRAFVADASHELRTPVAILDGYVRLLARWGKDDPQTREEAIRAMASETAHMRRLVERLLVAARQRGPRPFAAEPFRLNELGRSVVEGLSLTAGEKAISLSFEGSPCTVVGDSTATREALLAVLENAIKFSPRGSSVTVRTAAQDGVGRIRVADQGPGIPAREAEHVFDRFFRGEPSRTGRETGSGLGLSIAKELMEAQKGRIRLVRTSPEGTEFALDLPLGHQA